ncbi:hypothetical protein E4T47_06695 [Aureobasidium subglaciale]|nr:hypothetical protein E4T47_06695 [Aureobasidium subglaciale]
MARHGQMSEWRDRGYVPDSDEDGLVLDELEDFHSNTQPTTTTTPRQRQASVELLSDSGADNGQHEVPALHEEGAGTPTNAPRYWEPITSPITGRHEPPRWDLQRAPSKQDAPEDSNHQPVEPSHKIPTHTTRHVPRATQLQPSAGQPIVLITQHRRAQSPPDSTDKNARTYSRKLKPGALKSIKSTPSARHEEEKDDDFMDIDALIAGDSATQQASPPSAPLVVPSHTGRRLSVSSSDLSDVDMQVLSSSQPFFAHFSSTARTNESIPILPRQPVAAHLESAINALSEQRLAALAAHRPRRNLRTRKAIQLHPYLIEIEQYRRSLKARGLRPIQVATNSQRPRDQDDSQDAEFRQEESQPRHQLAADTQESTPPDSSAASTHIQPPRLDLTNLMLDDGDEFPDLDAAIRRHVIGGTQVGHKRRKTLQTPHAGQHDGTLSRSTSRARGKLRSLNLTRAHSGNTSVLNSDLLPPSPPRTSSPANVEPNSAAPPRFRLPHGLTPADVPTPLPSSPEPPVTTSVGRSRKVIISSDNDSASQADAFADASSASGSDKDDRHLMRMQRRIRGVLPASYLKLDRHTRPPSPPTAVSEVQTETPRPTALVRGVAQRRVTSHSATSARQTSYVFFSDNSESDSSLRELPVPRLLQTTLPSPVNGRLSGHHYATNDVDEHDEIDEMFPTGERSRFRLPPGHKKQARLTDTFGFASKHPASSKSHARYKHAAPGSSIAGEPKSHLKTAGKANRRVARKKPQKLSILDAAASVKSKSPQKAPKPQFVRLAARQARNRPDHGRHSPSNKNIRLATREDTQDALSPLVAWQVGELERTWNPPIPWSAHSVGNVDEGSTRDRLGAQDGQQASRSIQARQRRPAQPRPLPGTRPIQPRKPGEGSDNARKRLASREKQANQRSLLERDHRMRPAQLETIAQFTRRDLDPLTFAAPPSRLMEIFARDRGQQSASRYRLERFLKDQEPLPEAASGQVQEPDTTITGIAGAANGPRSRKRLARRLDTETARFRQPDEPLPLDNPSVLVTNLGAVDEPHAAVEEILQGLGSFGTRYPTDFDVRPLEVGTYFASSTFVGSGDFYGSLTLRDRNLDVPAGYITLEVSGRSLHWSAWDEDVSTGLGIILAACTEDLHAVGEFESADMRRTAIEDTCARFTYLLRSTVRYLSGCLHFLDPIDRSSCVNRLARFIDGFSEMMDAESVVLKMHSDTRNDVDHLVVDSLLYLLCLTVQSACISHHPAIDGGLQRRLVDTCVSLSKKIVTTALPPKCTALRNFLDSHRGHAQRNSGIRERDIAVKSIMIVNHVLDTTEADVKLSGVLSAHLGYAIELTCNIHSLDQIWYDAFAVQPVLELDAKGIYRPGSRFRITNDNWDLIKSLLQRMFTLYPATSKVRGPNLNDYVRACLARVYHLITRWSWRRCEVALGMIYDFFAKNGLSQLHREEGKGSPRFLEDLNKDPTIELEASDCAFHIFLKLLVVGLRGLQEELPKNKVRGFAWRFIPNHGRTYRKDQEVTHVALDALRNHHDLLCTLYWVMPSGCGPRLQMIKDLVDHSNSHREACRLSVHAWGILARYQLSQVEQSKDIESMASWCKDMIATTVSQYRFARSEAEAQYTAERSKGSFLISSEMLESTITVNQRSIFAILQDLLLVIRNAIRVAKSWPAVVSLVEQSKVVDVLSLFDTEQPRLSVAIIQTLDVVEELLAAKERLCRPMQQESQPGSDDSQDYGDWSFMDQVVEEESDAVEPKVSEVNFLQEPLAGLLSTCFGSEKSPDDALLKKVVDVWVAIADRSVKDGAHDWSSYVDTYSTKSWFQLRETEQRHKYTCYFLAAVIKSDRSSLYDHRNLFMKAWFISLFERESMLKFQHRFTASLLEKATTEPLLRNLPFAADHRTGEYHITMAELRQRRISLIASILSNMHSSMNSLPTHTVMETRREYADMLKAAMQHMRRTYEQLERMTGQLGGLSYEGTQGAYVSLVHDIVSLMQQYTSDLCPVDPFFADSSAFPLPVDDPTYVKAKLKSYVFKLEDSRARKQLAVFVQTVSQRSASENQQQYLYKQVHEALAGRSSRLLRKVLFTSIFPAYITCSESSTDGWVLATTLMEASAVVFDNVICDLDTQDENGLDSDVHAITYMLIATYGFATSMPNRPTSKDIGSLRLLAAIFSLAENSLTFVDYVHRVRGKASMAKDLLRGFMIMGDQLSNRIMNPSADEFDVNLTTPAAQSSEGIQCPWQDTLDFATRSLSDSLARGPQRPWETDLQSLEVESMRVVAATEMFKRSYEFVMGCEDVPVARLVDEIESDADDEAEEDEQETRRYELDEMIRGIRGLGWGSLL